MFRKTILAVAATAALGAAALSPTAASAGWHGGHHHHNHYGHGHYKSYGFYAPVYAGYVRGGCVWKKRWVETGYGSVKRWVKVCY